MSFPTPEQLCIRFNEIKLPTDKDSSSSSVAVSSGDDDSSGVQSSGVQSSIGFDLLVVEVARDVSEFRPIDGSDEAQEGVDRIMHYYHGQQAFVLGTLLRQPKCRSALPWSYPELSTSELNVSDDPWKIDYTCYDILNVNCNLVTYLITNRPDMGLQNLADLPDNASYRFRCHRGRDSAGFVSQITFAKASRFNRYPMHTRERATGWVTAWTGIRPIYVGRDPWEEDDPLNPIVNERQAALNVLPLLSSDIHCDERCFEMVAGVLGIDAGEVCIDYETKCSFQALSLLLAYDSQEQALTICQRVSDVIRVLNNVVSNDPKTASPVSMSFLLMLAGASRHYWKTTNGSLSHVRGHRRDVVPFFPDLDPHFKRYDGHAGIRFEYPHESIE